MILTSASFGIAAGIGFFIGWCAAILFIGRIERSRANEANLAVEYWQKRSCDTEAERRKMVEALKAIVEDQE